MEGNLVCTPQKEAAQRREKSFWKKQPESGNKKTSATYSRDSNVAKDLHHAEAQKEDSEACRETSS